MLIHYPGSLMHDPQAVFRPGGLLASMDHACLENDGAVIYAVDRDFHLIYCNAAWDSFGEQNGAPELHRASQIGLPLMRVVPAPLREFYRRALDGVLATGIAWSFAYECSSAQVERHFRMVVQTTPRRDALLVVNSLISETVHQRPELPATSLYHNLAGIIIMCAHCRRVRTSGLQGRWDWVPEFVERMPDSVSHSLCPVCKTLHFGVLRRA